MLGAGALGQPRGMVWGGKRGGSGWGICPSADEWIRKLWYIYTMEYYSAIKKNAFESVLMRWMKLEPVIQREVSSFMLMYGKTNTIL